MKRQQTCQWQVEEGEGFSIFLRFSFFLLFPKNIFSQAGMGWWRFVRGRLRSENTKENALPEILLKCDIFVYETSDAFYSSHESFMDLWNKVVEEIEICGCFSSKCFFNGICVLQKERNYGIKKCENSLSFVRWGITIRSIYLVKLWFPVSRKIIAWFHWQRTSCWRFARVK